MKGDKINKAEEFLYKLSLRPKCFEIFTTFRKKTGLPLGGIGKNKEWKKEWERLASDPKI